MSQPARYYLRLSPQESGWIPINFIDLWEHRELIGFLAWREISSRYRQAVLGAAWAIIQPVLTMLIFTIIFSRLAKVPSDGLPYCLFAMAALLPWQYYQSATQVTANSLVTNTALITKVYFPRLVIPIAYTLPALLDMFIAFAVLLCIFPFYGVTLTHKIFYLPAFIFIMYISVLGVGLWYSALCVEYRDVRHVIPFITQLLMFASPIVYSSSLVPAHWKVLYALNPMVAIIDGFRWSCLGDAVPSTFEIASAVFSSIFLLFSGLLYFRKMERSFADVI